MIDPVYCSVWKYNEVHEFSQIVESYLIGLLNPNQLIQGGP